MKRAVLILAWMVLLAVSQPSVMAAAQTDGGLVTWVVYYRVAPKDTDTFVDLVRSYYGRTLDAEMASGNVVGWGVADKTNDDDGATHLAWIGYPSWSAMQEVGERLETEFTEMDANRKAHFDRTFDEIVESMDESVYQGIVRRTDLDAPTPKFLVIGEYRARPGKAAEGTALYTEYGQPIYEQLLAEGHVTGYGLSVPALHERGLTHVTWFAIDGLGRMDAVSRAFAGLESREFAERRLAAFDPAGHHDNLWYILHLGGLEE